MSDNVVPLSKRVEIARRHADCCDDCVNTVHRIAAVLNDRFTDDQIRRLIERLRLPA